MEKNIHEVTLTKYAAKAGVIKFGTWGSRGIEQLHITALPPWDEAAVITVTFVNGRVQSEPQVFPESMTIDVPQAATSAATKSRASCKMVFKGIDQGGAVVYSTDLPYTVLNRTDIDGAEYDPGKNAFEQYIQQVGAYRDTTLNAANSARNSELSAEEYADSAKAAKDDARKSAESAAASAAGIAESEKRAAASAASAAGSAASAEETRKQVEKIAAGVAKGNMSVSDYDNDGAVKAAGGIKAYTKAQIDAIKAYTKAQIDAILTKIKQGLMTLTVHTDDWETGEYTVTWDDGSTSSYTARASVAAAGVTADSQIAVSDRTRVTDAVRMVAALEAGAGVVKFYANAAPTSAAVFVVEVSQ